MSQNINVLLRNNIKVIGKGRQVLVLAHGFGSDQNTWNPLIPYLENDYRLVLFDHIGAGKADNSSYDSEKYSTLNGYAADIVEICKELALEHAIYIGHSASGMMGVLAAQMDPTIFRKLVFIGPSPRYINDENYHGGIDEAVLKELLSVMESNYLGWSRTMGPAIIANDDRPELGESLANSFCTLDPEIAKETANTLLYADNRADLPLVKVPSLTIQGQNDILTSERVARYIHEHMPDNQLVILNSSGHCPHLSDTENVAGAILNFIKD